MPMVCMGFCAVNADQIQSVLKGAFMAGAGAIIAVIATAASSGALGPWSPIIGALASVLVNILHKTVIAPTPTK